MGGQNFCVGFLRRKCTLFLFPHRQGVLMHQEKQFTCLVACLRLLSLPLSPNGAAPSSIVFPRLLEERSGDGELVVAVRDDTTLTLRKASVLKEDFDITTFERGHQVLHRMNGRSMERNLYHDPESHAALMVRRNGGLRLTGILEGHSRIQPLDSTGANLPSGIPHEIVPIENKATDGNSPVYFEGREEPQLTLLHEVADKYQRINLEERSEGGLYPLNLTCETRFAVDATFMQAFKGSKTDVAEYFAVLAAFMNLKLQSFQSHIVILRLMVTGIVIFNSEEEKKFSMRHKDDSSILLDSTLYQFNLYASSEQIFAGDDAILLFTGLDLGVRYGQPTPGVRTNTLGLAQVSGACSFHKTALVEDMARTFSSVHVAAHELGHLLGSLHDGSKPTALITKSGIDPSSCPADEKHIMAPYAGTHMKPVFSYCTTTQVVFFVLTGQGRCLTTTVSRRTRIVTINDILRTRPSPESFCRQQYHDVQNVYFQEPTDPDSPNRLKKCMITCRDPSRHYLELVADAPDGFECDKDTGRICMNSVCTTFKEGPLQTFGNDAELTFGHVNNN